MDWTKNFGRKPVGRKQVGRKLGARNDLPNISDLIHPTIFANDTAITLRDSS